MCVLIVCEKRKLTEEEYRQAFRSNGDGAGFAWFEGKNVQFRKGFMGADDGWTAYKELEVLPHVVHFRKGTSGGVVPGLTHPFLVTDWSDLHTEYEGTAPILFHNGVLQNWRTWERQIALNERKRADGPVSDTRMLAMVLARIGVDNFEWFVEGGYDKFVVMADGKITMYGQFSDDNGISASNSTYKSFTSFPRAASSFPSGDEDGYPMDEARYESHRQIQSEIGGIPVGNSYPEGTKKQGRDRKAGSYWATPHVASGPNSPQKDFVKLNAKKNQKGGKK